MKSKLILTLLLLLFFWSCNDKSTGPAIPVSVGHDIQPVLIRKSENPVLHLEIDNTTGKEIQLTSVTLSAQGSSTPGNIENVQLYFTGSYPQFRPWVLFGNTQAGTEKIVFNGHQILKPGKNHFWVSLQLKPETPLDEKIDIQCKKVVLPGYTPRLQTTGDTGKLSVGVAVRMRQDDGCDSYRIPGLVCTPKGTLIAVYDARWNSSVDLQEDIDVCISRSVDGGQSWLPMQKAIDMKTWGNKPERENGIGDPAILVDPQTGRLWIAALWLHGHPGERAWWASKPGISPEQTGQFILAYSDDEGASWSDPINITPQVKKPEWYLCFNGPGMGITTREGVLVFAAQYKDKNQMPYSTIVYSKDKGKTWHIGTGAKSNTTEAQVVELADGSLMLNMRDNRGGSRSVAVTKDFGKTWTEHTSSRSALREPVCQASLIRITSQDGRPALAFFNPDSDKNRNNLSLKLSFDEGKTWPEKYCTLVYKPDSFGYSCLTQIDSSTLGVLYEGAGDLYFQRINLEEILR